MDTIGPGGWVGFGFGALVWFMFWIFLIYVTFQKGKSGFGWLGIAGFLIPVLMVFPLIGSIRVAKPSSDYATKNYHEGKMTTAVERFPNDPGPRPDWLQHHITFGK